MAHDLALDRRCGHSVCITLLFIQEKNILEDLKGFKKLSLVKK